MSDGDRCSTCKCWHSWPAQPMAGTCKRYPKAEHKMADDWCGEHRPRHEDAMTLDELQRQGARFAEWEREP